MCVHVIYAIMVFSYLVYEKNINLIDAMLSVIPEHGTKP